MNSRLIEIILENREQIKNEWIQQIQTIPHTKYSEQPVSALLASLEEALNAFIEAIESSSYDRLEAYIQQLCMNRMKMGFDISEVTHAILMANDVLLPYIIRGFEGTPEKLLSAISIIGYCTRWTLSRFNDLYSKAINQRLQQNFEALKRHDNQLAEQKEQLEQKVRQISSLMKSARVVNSTLNLDKVLKYIVEQACDLIGIDVCVIYELDEITNELSIRAAHANALNVKKYENMRIPFGEEFVRLVKQHKQRFHIDDVKKEQREELQFLISALERETIQAMLTVPLKWMRNILGGIAVFCNQPHKFSAEEISLLSSFSAHAALAIENARLYERSRQTAILTERNRLAREIHDTIAQGLAGIVLQVELVDRLMNKDLNKARVELQKVKESVRNHLQEARRSVWGLRAGTKIQLSLIDALKAEIEKIEFETNLGITFDVEGDIYSLLPEAENNVFRIFQESMNNVLQHARATQVGVILTYGIEVFTMRIKDNGIGLKSMEGKKRGIDKGFGLMGMQERARFLQGQLEIDSSQGKGTTITIHIPARKWYQQQAQSENFELTEAN